MSNNPTKTGSELFIVDNSDQDWKVLRYLHDWCQLSNAVEVPIGTFGIGSLISLIAIRVFKIKIIYKGTG